MQESGNIPALLIDQKGPEDFCSLDVTLLSNPYVTGSNGDPTQFAFAPYRPCIQYVHAVLHDNIYYAHLHCNFLKHLLYRALES